MVEYFYQYTSSNAKPYITDQLLLNKQLGTNVLMCLALAFIRKCLDSKHHDINALTILNLKHIYIQSKDCI